jgi:hypothetical protein
VTDAIPKLKAARTEQCRLYHARVIVAEREAAGVYAAVIQGEIGADMREALALALVRDAFKETP